LFFHVIAKRYERASTIESWRTEYNTEHPHSSLGDLTPNEFMRRSVTEDKKIGFFQQ
jgi:transposase InsO family protein